MPNLNDDWDPIGDVLKTPQQSQQRQRQLFRDAHPPESPQQRSTPFQDRLNSPQSHQQARRQAQRNIFVSLDGSPRRRRTIQNNVLDNSESSYTIDENTPISANLTAQFRADHTLRHLQPQRTHVPTPLWASNQQSQSLTTPLPPSRRALAARARHEHNRSSQPATPIDSPAPVNARSVAQRARRQREAMQRAANTQLMTPPSTSTNNQDQLASHSVNVTQPTINTNRARLSARPPSNAQLLTPPATQAVRHVNINPQLAGQPEVELVIEQGGLRVDNGQRNPAPSPQPIRRRTNSRPPLLFCAARRPYPEITFERHYLGSMEHMCSFCNALHWLDERLSGSSAGSPTFTMCCNKGQVRLPPLPPPPAPLHALLEGSDVQSKEFKENIRQYNMALAFTSLGVKDDKSVNQRGGWVFRILGQLCHNSGALVASEGTAPAYAQLYLYDPVVALRQRLNRNSNLREDTMKMLQTMLVASHRYATVYKQCFEILAEHGDVEDAEIRLRVLPGQDRRRYNLPTSEEVAMILPGDGSAQDHRDIILRTRMPSNSQLYRINDSHPAYAPLHYVLLFPHGEHGWHYELQLHQPEKDRPARLSQTRYTAYRLQVRHNEFSTILRGGRLFQQYATDMFVSADQNRLQYLRQNQSVLRASLYSGLEDAVDAADGDVDLNSLGLRFVLPSSYIGGPRHMQQRFQDAMAIAQYFGKVDIFMTVTANPHWKEVTDALFDGQTSYDRPDLVARVFQLKKEAILADIWKNKVFGPAVAYVYTIEFQKRGLPHMHILIFLENGYKLLTPEDIDRVIQANWPDPEMEPLLFETIKRCMVHGPCGALNPNAPCMENGKCTKHYPKEFQPYTTMDEDGYPKYCRKNDSRTYRVGRFDIDNRWIIPFNPYFSFKYDCHINVECAVSIRSIKYPFKYIHKGGDRASLEVSRDEIKTYIDGRYIAAPEAIWRTFHFDVHEQIPNVVRLQVHLPGQHMVAFNPNEDPQMVLARAASEKTTLTQFFIANNNDGEIGEQARKCTYQEFPQYFVWKDGRNGKQWEIRKRGFALGRMFHVTPTAGERFYLRTLLTVVKGLQSFEDLRTYQGVIYETFREACLARGLLEDDGEWRVCLHEASVMQTGHCLRQLFATLLLFCNLSQPDVLWLEFREHICDDLHAALLRAGHVNPSDENVYDYGLFLLNKILQESGGYTLRNFPPMPLPINCWDAIVDNPLIAAQLSYNRNEERDQAIQRVEQFNEDQQRAYERIMDSIKYERGKVFFLNGAGGCGKTFVYNTVAHQTRAEGWIILCVGSSGISALLLPDGRTAHSMFKIPVDGLTEESVCSIPKESLLADLIRVVRAVIWDEALMQHRYTHEAVDRTFRDLRGIDKPFGGVTMIFGGDSQQILPVVPKGSREEIIAASLPRSYLWGNVEILQLRKNMRLEPGSDEEVFAKWLLDVGHGREISNDGTISFPSHMRVVDEKSLINFIYSGIDRLTPPPEYFLQRIILAARNSDIDGINSRILEKMSGEARVFMSADVVVREAGADGPIAADDDIPVEYLRSLSASGLPPGELSIKPGCPLILLRNLAPAQGLCNGTRMVVVRASDCVLEVKILGGKHDGELAFVPRITLTPSGKNTDFTFTLRRRQFPVRLAFAISINKAQGQSARYVGLDVRVPVFTHGQLYVALSRATSGQRVKVLLPDDATDSRTLNIVYPEVLFSNNENRE